MKNRELKQSVIKLSEQIKKLTMEKNGRIEIKNIRKKIKQDILNISVDMNNSHSLI